MCGETGRQKVFTHFTQSNGTKKMCSKEDPWAQTVECTRQGVGVRDSEGEELFYQRRKKAVTGSEYDMSARIQLWMKEKSEEECSKNEQC